MVALAELGESVAKEALFSALCAGRRGAPTTTSAEQFDPLGAALTRPPARAAAEAETSGLNGRKRAP